MAPMRNIESYRDHVLDALALNSMEASRLHNPATPEPDSLLEYIETLPMEDHSRRVLRGCANSVFMLNAREGDCERSAVPTLEEACRRKYRYSVQRIADELRPVLAQHDGTGFVRQVFKVRELLAHEQVGREVLLSGALAHELGDGPAGRLVELVEWIEAAA